MLVWKRKVEDKLTGKNEPKEQQKAYSNKRKMKRTSWKMQIVQDETEQRGTVAQGCSCFKIKASCKLSLFINVSLV